MSASDTVRGRLWMWGHEAGSHDNGWKLPKPSRTTPAEGALYLGVPNLMMVTYGGRAEMPFDQYAIPFRALEKVVWSITGASGQTSPEEREHVIGLTQRFPNFTGLLMDDLFATDGTAAMSVGEAQRRQGEAGSAGEEARPLRHMLRQVVWLERR